MTNFLKYLSLLFFSLFLSSCGGDKTATTLSEETFLPSGDFTKSVFLDGLSRTYLLHIPQGYSPNVKHSLIIALHGGGGSAEKMVELTKGGFNEISEREKILVVYPKAVENHWNDGRRIEFYYSQSENVDDVKFISTVIDNCIQNYSVDSNRVYVTGMSNGALMSFRLISELSGKIEAVAPVCGSIPVNYFPYFSPENPVSVLIVNGTEDPLILWEGGDIVFGDLNLGKVLPVEQVFSILKSDFNCASFSSREYLEDNDPDDGTRVWVESYTSCSKNVVLTLCGIEGGGHTWPSGDSYLPESIVGKICFDINGCEFIWSFFKNKTRY